MRAPAARVVLACYVLAQCAVIVCGRGCFNPEGPRFTDGSFRCALQFFATGMEGKSVSLDLFDPDRGAIRTPDAPFDEEKAVVEFTAGINGNAPSCLLLEKIEVTFKASYNIDSIDKLVLDSFEGEVPATQEALGQCFTVRQRELLPDVFGPPHRRDPRVGNGYRSTVYGTVYADLWCAFQPGRAPDNLGTPEQMAFEQRPGPSALESGC